MAGTHSPVPIVYLDESIGFLVPSFLRPDGSGPSSLRSGLSSLRPGLSSPTYRFITISCVGVLICISKFYHLFSSSIFTYSNMTVCYIGANNKCDVIFSIVHGLFYSFIPFCIITVLNVKILKKLKLQQTFRASSQFSTSRDTSLVPMMLAISVAFALTTFPIMLLIICSLTLDLAGFKWNLNSNWIFILAIGLVNLNHSLNFFLYCVTGTVFRNAFFSLMKCKASSTDSPQQVDTVSSTVL